MDKRHPDDVPRLLADLSSYLSQTYGIRVSAWSLGNLIRSGTLPARKVAAKWHSTAAAYLEMVTPRIGGASGPEGTPGIDSAARAA